MKLVLEKKKKWALIAKIISGRTENSVKNRFSSLISRYFRQPGSIEDMSTEKETELIHQIIKEKQQESSKISTDGEANSTLSLQHSDTVERQGVKRPEEITLDQMIRLNSQTKDLLLNQAQSLISQSCSESRLSGGPIQYNYILDQLNGISSSQTPVLLPQNIFQHQLVSAAPSAAMPGGPFLGGLYQTGSPTLYSPSMMETPAYILPINASNSFSTPIIRTVSAHPTILPVIFNNNQDYSREYNPLNLRQVSMFGPSLELSQPRQIGLVWMPPASPLQYVNPSVLQSQQKQNEILLQLQANNEALLQRNNFEFLSQIQNYNNNQNNMFLGSGKN